MDVKLFKILASEMQQLAYPTINLESRSQQGEGIDRETRIPSSRPSMQSHTYSDLPQAGKSRKPRFSNSSGWILCRRHPKVYIGSTQWRVTKGPSEEETREKAGCGGN